MDCDTVQTGDSIVIEAIFTNISDKSIEFFPNSIFLVKPVPAFFDIKVSLEIDVLSNNLGYIVKIEEKESFRQKYKISTADDFFDMGINKVWLSYRFSIWSQQVKQSKNIRHIRYITYSPEVSLFIK
jgi:hypothetical protein